MDDILLTGSDKGVLTETKHYLRQHFVIKDIENQETLLGLKLHTRIIDCFFLIESLH